MAAIVESPYVGASAAAAESQDFTACRNAPYDSFCQLDEEAEPRSSLGVGHLEEGSEERHVPQRREEGRGSRNPATGTKQASVLKTAPMALVSSQPRREDASLAASTKTPSIALLRERSFVRAFPLPPLPLDSESLSIARGLGRGGALPALGHLPLPPSPSTSSKGPPPLLEPLPVLSLISEQAEHSHCRTSACQPGTSGATMAQSSAFVKARTPTRSSLGQVASPAATAAGGVPALHKAVTPPKATLDPACHSLTKPPLSKVPTPPKANVHRQGGLESAKQPALAKVPTPPPTQLQIHAPAVAESTQGWLPTHPSCSQLGKEQFQPVAAEDLSNFVAKLSPLHSLEPGSGWTSPQPEGLTFSASPWLMRRRCDFISQQSEVETPEASSTEKPEGDPSSRGNVRGPRRTAAGLPGYSSPVLWEPLETASSPKAQRSRSCKEHQHQHLQPLNWMKSFQQKRGSSEQAMCTSPQTTNLTPSPPASGGDIPEAPLRMRSRSMHVEASGGLLGTEEEAEQLQQIAVRRASLEAPRLQSCRSETCIKLSAEVEARMKSMNAAKAHCSEEHLQQGLLKGLKLNAQGHCPDKQHSVKSHKKDKERSGVRKLRRTVSSTGEATPLAHESLVLAKQGPHGSFLRKAEHGSMYGSLASLFKSLAHSQC